MNNRPRQIPALLGFLLLCFAASGLGGIATSSSVGSWYADLDKPWFSPPDWVFGPVWALLYTAMAVAAWLVWRTGGPIRGALGLFGVQLALNVLWSVLFFGLRQPGLAAVEIAVLLASILATAHAFLRHSRPAALLMVPYAFWVSFAAVLNVALWHLN